jgi:hypothetical protein
MNMAIPEVTLDTPENKKRLAAFEQRAMKDEENEKRAVAEARLFDPQELIREADDIGTIKDEILGTIRFGRLTLKEYRTIMSSGTDTEDKSYRILHAMLKKAYGNLTYDQIEKMPFDKLARLSDLLSSEITRFLRKPQ